MMRRTLERNQQLEQRQKRWSWGGTASTGTGTGDGELKNTDCIAGSKTTENCAARLRAVLCSHQPHQPFLRRMQQLISVSKAS